ncbi:hypothetical protein MTO96_000428 [Rhipicephalus appendiculatus]
MLGLLMLCPQEVAHLRKELLIAARHILATDLRNKFVGCMEQLFDENILIGSGWTAYESLRPLAYSTLADLVHHVRQHLPLNNLSSAVAVFSRNVHDESLPASIQTMSCKLLLNLVECIRTRSDQENGNGRELLIRMLEVFVLKFKTIAKCQLPVLMQKSRQQGPPSEANRPDDSARASLQFSASLADLKEEKNNSYTVADCRSLVKTLVCGVKTITWGIGTWPLEEKQFQPKETLVFIRLVKYALQALDVYTLPPGTGVIAAGATGGAAVAASSAHARTAALQSAVRSKEEKEVLDHFGGVFTMMSPSTFREVFSTTIEYVVERLNKNSALQIVANFFLANRATSPIFATILVEYLLERMEEMGANPDKSNLYLKLFKLVFGSVSLFAAENELMLKPHLHRIVNRSMELALSAREPYNYFLLLRALFRSIGGGSHDLLYQEFLPLLPSLLQGLNGLQSGLHKQHMKDLFVELCLTVPVRLSSLLPYLPMLMDPLVSALNGSQTLISQGLRTLELCVDNLQPDFLYDHIQPVRAELMQALWRTLRNPTDSIAQVAFRVLGKFGGGNRKMLMEPQRLEYCDRDTPGPCITVHFQDHKTPIALPVDKLIETAFNALKQSGTDSFYRRQCWEIIRGFLVANLQLDDDRQTMLQLFSHPSFGTGDISPPQTVPYKCQDVETRKVHQMALTGMFAAAAIKELHSQVLPFLVSLVHHYTLVAVAQQAGPLRQTRPPTQGMDPSVLVGQLAMLLITENSATVLTSRERACQLPHVEYLAERLCALCYDRAWYAKSGGCFAIKCLVERLPLRWVLGHQYLFLKALFFIMMDLTGEVSNGAVDMAKSNLEKMLTVCGAPLPADASDDLREVQRKSLHEVTLELVRQVTSPNTCVRQQAIHSLEVLAQVMGCSVGALMEPHRDVLADMVPPKKHLLRHQPLNAQIGLMEGNTYCTSLQPRLFALDVSVTEHKTFFSELVSLCEADDEALRKLPCYKGCGPAALVSLRRAALRALATCHYLPCRERVFHVLYRALNARDPELQEAAFQCIYCNTWAAGLKWPCAPPHRGPNATEVRQCAAIIAIFHQIPAAGPAFVKPLVTLVLRHEQQLMVEASSPFQAPLRKFLERHPATALELLLAEPQVQDEQLNRFLEHLLRDGATFRAALQRNTGCIDRLAQLLDEGGPELQRLAVRIVAAVARREPQFLAERPALVARLRAVWVSDSFQTACGAAGLAQWREPKLLCRCLLGVVQQRPHEIELLFQLLRAFTGRFLPDFGFLRDFLDTWAAKGQTVEWKRAAFFRFVEAFGDPAFPQPLLAKVLQQLLIPAFAASFERGEGEALIGGPPQPERDSPDNVISVFINRVIDPENPFGTSDAVRILLLQFSCLLVEQASPHIHDAANKRQGIKLRRLMTFAWPCLLGKNCVDPATKYHGHLLLAHIIAKFAIHKRIVLQVFHSLLKAHAVEARSVVRQALEILTPAMPARMEDGNTMLTHWTKKIIVEEGHTLAQLVHMLQLLYRHYRVYYPVRHHLVQHMVSSVQRLGFTPNANIEHKKLAVDLAEVVIRWEMQRHREEQQQPPAPPPPQTSEESRRLLDQSGRARQAAPRPDRPIEKHHADALVNFLLRMACQVNESSTNIGSQGEVLSRRCVALLKTALKPDVWPNSELKLAWFDKLLMTVESAQPNYGNICTALELLAFLLSILRPEAILSSLKPLQRGIAACMTCPNSKVIRAVHALLSRLMGLFPSEPTTSSMASRHEELESLYTSISKVVYEGLTTYEKSPAAPPSTLFGCLMILKAACVNHPCYIDRLITPFMHVLQKMAREHLSPGGIGGGAGGQESSSMGTELLILSLDLVKNRVGVMGQEMRKAFIGAILVGLIEKSPDVKVLRAITKMVEDWVKSKSPFAVNQSPTLREKSILLVKMMQFMEKRFPDELELNGQFLELVNHVYRDETLKGTELTSKLEPAFMAGLRCVQPTIRAKFFEVFDSSMRRRLHERLLFIVCSQNWETIGPHFWIKQCIELVLGTAVINAPLRSAQPATLLPAATAGLQSLEDIATTCPTALKEEPTDTEEEIDIELPSSSELCHLDTPLAQHLWQQLMPRLWKVLSDRQQSVLAGELVPFLCSGSHVVQKDCHPNAIGVFVEALAQCNPPVAIKPALIKYLGRSHNLWHRACLLLEQAALTGRGGSGASCSSVVRGAAEEAGSAAEDALAELYSLLREEDLLGGLWQRRARHPETPLALALEQQGCFEQAQAALEAAMARAPRHEAAGMLQSECRLWEEHWLRCCKELNQWELVLEYGSSKSCANPHLVLESAWRVPNWPLMKEALSQVELSCPKEQAWRVNLYRGYIAICHPEEQHLSLVERVVEVITGQCIREWRRLPQIVSHVHVPLLQAAQQIMELQEAAQIHQGLLPTGSNVGRPAPTSVYDMRAIVKTWRNRLAVLTDDLSHWSDIFTWRQHHYQAIVSHFDNAPASLVAEIARKHGLVNVCLDSLSRIHTIPSVPIVDCFQKIRQQVKCYLQLSHITGKNELQEGLDVIESTNLKYFARDMTAEFYALKGLFLTQMGRSEEANKALSASVQLHDTLVNGWALWGDYFEGLFGRDRWDSRQLPLAVSALTCYLHACRHQSEPKGRKYMAKVLWLLTYDNEQNVLAETVDKYNSGVPPLQWLPWVPQLLTCLVRPEGRQLLNLLVQVGRVYPQAVYFPIRTLYLTLKIEQRERYKSSEEARAPPSTPASSTLSQPQQPTEAASPQAGDSAQADTSGPIRATPSMWRCSKIMHLQRDLHPTVLSSLEGIVDQMVWFRENWYEEVLRQLRQGLAKCYAVAFENRGGVADATVTPHTLNFLKKLVSTFGVGIENVSSVTTTFSSAASESLARRAQATAQDPVFQKMKGQFTTDFDFGAPGAMKLHNLINKLKKWIKILEAKTKLLPKSLLIEEKCRFLSNFSQQTADVALPGEFLMPKHSHYYVRVARFMPRVEIVQKYNTAARRLYLRGQNGKIYPYLVVNDACLSDARREERVLQLLRMLNNLLDKQKETARRFLHLAVPRVVAVSPQMRLVEDNPASVSLLHIYKQRCGQRGVEHDAPVGRYYERLAAVQARGSQASHQVLRDILRDVQGSMVPRTLLRDWALTTFQAPTHYWTFRKQFTLQLALAGFAEFVMHLTRLNPDMMYLHQDSGFMNFSYFKFDVDDISGDLDANRPVPFRLTPNLSEFMTSIGVAGSMTAGMIATARCVAQPNFKLQALLRAILRDEFIAWHKKKQDDSLTPGSAPQDMDGELLISMVSKAVSAVMSRLQTLATFDGADSKVSTLVAAANSHDNLCRMDPAWHPWL